MKLGYQIEMRDLLRVRRELEGVLRDGAVSLTEFTERLAKSGDYVGYNEDSLFILILMTIRIYDRDFEIHEFPKVRLRPIEEENM